MTTDTRASRHTRRQELERMRKEELVQMHVRNGGIMGAATYRKWTKEELINIILEVEAERG